MKNVGDPLVGNSYTWDVLENLFFQLCAIPESDYARFFEDNQVKEELRTLMLSMLRNMEHTHTLLMSGVSGVLKVSAIAQAKDWLGRQLGNYTVTDVLGEGGSAIILRANQQDPVVRDVAIKMLYQHAPLSYFERFKLEHYSLAKLSHPNIATIYSVDYTPDGRPYQVMEYIEGDTLLKHCDRYKLNIKMRLALFSQVCAGISYSHQHGILHRDIKPENILVRKLDNSHIPQIIDFGIALDLSGIRKENDGGEKIGTPEFMSPEHLCHTNEMDVRSDIYSLGMLLLSLLVGKPLFPKEKFNNEPMEVKHNLLQTYKPESIRRYINTLPISEIDKAANLSGLTTSIYRKRVCEELDWIYQKATATCIDERYGSVSELMEDINRFSQNKPIEAAKGSTGYFIKKFIQRNIIISLSISTLAAFSLVFSAFIGLQNREIQQQYQVAEQQREIALSEKQTADHISNLIIEIFTNINPRFAQRNNNSEPLSISETIEQGWDRIDNDKDIPPAVRLPLLFTLAYTYFGLGDSDKSITILQELLNREHWPNEAFDASVHWLLSRSYGFDHLHKKSLHHAERAYQLMHENNVDAVRKREIIANLAERHGGIHNYEKALLYADQSFILAKSLHGEASRDAITEQAYYGDMLKRASQPKAAEKVLQKAWINFQNLQEDQQDNLSKIYILTQLSNTLIQLGDYTQGITYQKKAAEVAHTVFGKDHKQYLAVLNGLASYYAAAGLYDKAIPLGEKVVALSAQTHGADNMNYLIHKANLGIRYISTGKYAGGRSHLLETLRLSEQHHPNDRYNLAYVYSALAQSFLGSKSYFEAKSYIDKAKPGFEQTVGTRHIHYALSLMYSAFIDFGLADYKRGLHHLEEAQSIFEGTLNNTHKYVVVTNIALAYANYQVTGDNESLNSFLQTFASYKKRVDATTLLIDLFDGWIESVHLK